MESAQRMPLDRLALVAREVVGWLAFLGPIGLQQPDSRRATTPRAGHRHRLKHTPSFPVKKAYLLVLKPPPEDQTQVCHTPRDYTGAVWDSRVRTPSPCSPWASLRLAGISQRGAQRLVWASSSMCTRLLPNLCVACVL